LALVGELAGKQELSKSLEHWQGSELNRGQRLMSYGQGLGRSQCWIQPPHHSSIKVGEPD